MMSGSTSSKPSRFSEIFSIRPERRSSEMSRWPWVVALKSIRSIIPSSSGLALAIPRRWEVSRLAKISGRMKSLYLGASCAPRMLQAASQIQDSSDLSALALPGIGLLGFPFRKLLAALALRGFVGFRRTLRARIRE